jgi:hypothetical protein
MQSIEFDYFVGDDQLLRLFFHSNWSIEPLYLSPRFSEEIGDFDNCVLIYEQLVSVLIKFRKKISYYVG